MGAEAPAAPLAAGERRVFWLDAVRALAIISVTFNHALNRSVLDQISLLRQLNPYAFLGCLLYIFSRLGVPLFLMLSGALLLGRDYTQPRIRSRFYRHNWLRLVLATVLWLGIRYWFFLALNGELAAQGLGRTLRGFVKTLLLLNGDGLGCMWYMAMILCLYPLIPLLGVAVDRLPGRVFLVPGCIVLAVSILLPNLNAVLKAAGLSLRLQSGVEAGYLVPFYLLYLVGGWYLSQGALARQSTAAVAAVFCLGLLGTSLFQLWMLRDGAYLVHYADLGILITAAALFELLRRLARPGRRLAAPIRSLALHSLGVYFVHHLVMSLASVLFQRYLPGLTGFRCFAALELLGLGGGWLLVWLTARIPPVGRYLYLIQK